MDGFEDFQAVLELATGCTRTVASTKSRTCHGLPPKSLLLENAFIASPMEVESVAHP
jgi:hypothetical protein